MRANAVLKRLKRLADIGDRATEVRDLVYISVSEGSIGSVRLGSCYVHQEHQFISPLVDLIGDELVSKPL